MATISEAMKIAVQHHQQGELQEAERIYRQILQVQPNHADALHFLGIIGLQVGRPDVAVDYITRAITVNETIPIFHANLGKAWKDQGRLDEAVQCFHQSLRLKPDHAETHYNLGIALNDEKKLEEAVACYRRAVELKPDYAEAHCNLGSLLKDQGRLEEAVISYRRAAELRPNDVQPSYNLGITLRQLGDLDAAEAYCRAALERDRQDHEIYSSLGNILADQGKLEEAVACHRQALTLKPDYAEGQRNLGITWLKMGNFVQGWNAYEWRLSCEGLSQPPSSSLPIWDGPPLKGRRILLWSEQGLGDSLQFIRYAPLIQAKGGQVFTHCLPTLAKILATCPGVEQVVTQGEHLPELDCQISLMSLPRVFGTTLETIPASIPYLHADPELVQYWADTLGSVEGLKIGITWQGNPGHTNDRNRSFPITMFEPLANIPGVSLFSLQKGVGTEQLHATANHLSITDLGDRLNDMMDTAAVLKNLDLLICPDTAVTHLAGALGVPVWMALPFASDWRWLMDRQDSPWYSSLRIYRQNQAGDWPSVFTHFAADVCRLAGLSHFETAGYLSRFIR